LTREHFRRLALPAGAVVFYALCSWVIALPLGLAPRDHLPTCACADVAQEVWWLAVAAHAPFALHTAAIDVPRGVSLLDNASFPLLGAALSPLTAAAGPVASLAVLLRVAFVASASSVYWVLRRLRGAGPGPVIGGAVYAFFPYMTHQGASHVFLVFGPLPPLMLWIVYRRIAAREADPPARRWVAGVLLGLLGAAQFFVDSEVLALTVVAAAASMAVLALGRVLAGGSLRVPARALVSVLAPAGAVAVPILAVPVWATLTGPGRLVGSTQPTAETVGLLGTFLPGDRAIVAGAWAPWRVATGQYVGHSSYVGPVLIALCVVVAVRAWGTDPLVRAAAVLAGAAWVLQLGSHLALGAHPTSVPLPFDLIAHLPVLEDIIPSRFSQFVGLGVGVLVSVAVEGIVASWRAGRPQRRRAVVAAAVLVVGIGLAAPDQGFGAHGIGPARAFATGPAVAPGTGPDGLVPRGSVVLAYPVPAFPDDQAMLWQAVDGVHFRLVGGYAIRPGPGRRSDRAPLLPTPEALPAALVAAHSDPAALRPGSGVWDRAVRSLPDFVQRNRVRAVVVEQGVTGSGAVDALMRSVLGAPAYQRDALSVWVTATDATG